MPQMFFFSTHRKYEIVLQFSAMILVDVRIIFNYMNL